jgi:hypothetical protein
MMAIAPEDHVDRATPKSFSRSVGPATGPGRWKKGLYVRSQIGVKCLTMRIIIAAADAAAAPELVNADGDPPANTRGLASFQAGRSEEDVMT